MGIILAGLAALLAVTVVAALAVLRAGIWQQERAASLTCRPHGLSAAIARHVFGLHADLPRQTVSRAARPWHADGEPRRAGRAG